MLLENTTLDALYKLGSMPNSCSHSGHLLCFLGCLASPSPLMEKWMFYLLISSLLTHPCDVLQSLFSICPSIVAKYSNPWLECPLVFRLGYILLDPASPHIDALHVPSTPSSHGTATLILTNHGSK